MIEKIKLNYIYIIEILVFLFIFFIGSINENIIKFSKFTVNSKFIILIIFLIFLFLIYTVYFFKREKANIEKNFIILSMIFGLIYMIAFPINQLPDEANHASRAYEISEGHLISNVSNKNIGRNLDKNLYRVYSNKNYNNVKQNLKIKKTDNKARYIFANTALYSPISYIPQTVGIMVGKIFTNYLLIQMYIARLFNFICFEIIMYLAIKFMPYKKEILYFIGLFPLTLQEAISLSPDALTISVSCLFISYIFYLKHNKNKVTSRQLGFILTLGILLSQLKIVYLPLCLLIFLIPKSKFNNNKEKYLKSILILFIIFVCSIIWLNISSGFLKYQCDSSNQLKYILNNIFSYVIVCYNTIIYNSKYWLYETFSEKLGTLSINLPSFIIFINIILFIFMSLVSYSEKNNIKIKDKFIVLGIITMIIGLIFTSLYLQWTEYANRYISGIQGRYFIPFLSLFSLCLINNKVILKQRIPMRYFNLFISFENIYAIMLIVMNFI